MSDDFVEEFDTDDEEQTAPTTSCARQDSTNVLTNSENTNNENREKELNQQTTSSTQNNVTSGHGENLAASTNETSYMENTTYTDEGVAIYTDPETKFQYQWCTKDNKWVPYDSAEKVEGAARSNPYENEYYFWCTEKNEWQLKANYNYDETLKKWVPKPGVSEETFGKYKIIVKDGVRTYTDIDGAAYEWDEEKKAWFPKIDDDFMAVYQMSYGNYVPSEADKDRENKKRALVNESKPENTENESDTQDDGQPASKKMKKKIDPPKWFEIALEHNTKIYVENLPLDISEEDFVELMSKYGMIFKDPTTNKFKVKLYRNSDGKLKGDGLCTYIKVSQTFIFFSLSFLRK